MHKQTLRVEEVANILKVLGDPTRLTMLKLIEKEPCCVCEFVEIFDISQPAISQHVRKLKDVRLVMEERRGQWVFYHINKENLYFTLVQNILHHVPDQTYKLEAIEAAGKRLSCE